MAGGVTAGMTERKFFGLTFTTTVCLFKNKDKKDGAFSNLLRLF
jgi:hypothetical protein